MEVEGERIERRVIFTFSRPLFTDLKPAEKRLASLCDLSWTSVVCSVEHSLKITRRPREVAIMRKNKTTAGGLGFFQGDGVIYINYRHLFLMQIFHICSVDRKELRRKNSILGKAGDGKVGRLTNSYSSVGS